jgi:hypothetical protein
MSHDLESAQPADPTAVPARIDTQVWEKRPDGYLYPIRVKTVHEVLAEIRAAVGPDPAGAEEYLMASNWVPNEQPWPTGRIAVFVVTGDSEGHYLHVEVLSDPGHQLVLLGKTFHGKDAAWALARRIADLLDV